MAEALKENNALQVITLFENNIGDEGAQSLADSFVLNNSLCKLWLTRNEITDKGAKSLAVALKGNHTIEELDLWDSDPHISSHITVVLILSGLPDKNHRMFRRLIFVWQTRQNPLRSTILGRKSRQYQISTQGAGNKEFI